MSPSSPSMPPNPVGPVTAGHAIVQARYLPPCYPITPTSWSLNDINTVYQRIQKVIEHGTQLLQLRLPNWPVHRVRELAARLIPALRQYHAQLLLNADIEGARHLGVTEVGVQLKSVQLALQTARPLPWWQPVGASCHDATELTQAVNIDADFATLSPLAATASHPQVSLLGWARFSTLAEAVALPVYALGGVNPGQARIAQQAGGQGVSGISAFW